MNANELADLMEDMYPSVATMLRQQQTEIEALKRRELTDEEIEKEALKDKYWDYEDFDFMKFARAILRKAQEK